MASASAPGDHKHRQALSKDVHPESSLSWCLAHLCKPKPKIDNQNHSSKDSDKRWRMAQWRALVAIRTHHIKGDKSAISTLRRQGGLKPLLQVINHPDSNRKTLDLALSILANCCTEMETCVEVRKLDGINIVVEIMKRNMALVTVQNRAARTLGNLAMDPQSSALIHSAGGVPLLLVGVSRSPSSPSSTPSSPSSSPSSYTSSSSSLSDSSPELECAQSAARALLYLSDTPSHRLSLVSQGAVSSLAPLLSPEHPSPLRRAALRALHDLSRGCGLECAREVSRSGVLSQLGILAVGEGPLEELALKTLANVCSQGCLRPLVGSLGVIQRFIEEVKKDPVKSGVFLRALCLCCREAVNRAKVKDSGGLEALVAALAWPQSPPLVSRLVMMACVDFVFDEAAMEQLQELGLVPLLVSRLVDLTRGEDREPERGDASLTSSGSPTELLPSPCFDSFDFPPPEEKKEHGLCSSSFLSLRSWLLSEGLISSEGDLLESSSSADPDWTSLPLASPQTPNITTTSPSPSIKLPHASPPTSSAPQKPPECTSPVTSSSPSKFCSPPRRRQRDKASVLKFTLETPPSVSRSASYHPYHPEPWTTESPILLLLSRFSHVPDPSAALVTVPVVSGLLHYLGHHPDPSSRCFRLLCRLSVDPSCLQALVRSGSVGLIQLRLCERGKGGGGRGDRQSARVKAKVRQFGLTLMSNLRVQCESGFGAGVLSHVMLSGSESDKLNCALSLPLLSSNKTLLKKLLLDSGGLMFALQPLGGDTEAKSLHQDQDQTGSNPNLHSLYFPLLISFLFALKVGTKTDNVTHSPALNPGLDSSPPLKKPRLAEHCPYSSSNLDLVLLLDDGSKVPANREAVSGTDASQGSEYFRALLKGGFGEANCGVGKAIPIKDVSSWMLTPVLHYLHGCRFATKHQSTTGQKCHVLDAIVNEGINQDEDFEKTRLGEFMIGACRFLASELQKELEDICESMLTSILAVNKDDDDDNEILANRTSELELNVQNCPKSSGKLKPAVIQDWISLLPQVYWFSQRYSYTRLGQSCLCLLTGSRLSRDETGDCLRRLVKEADCTDALRQDLLALASNALS